VRVTVENLLRGSDEINRMREEIALIIGLVWSNCPRPEIGSRTPNGFRPTPKPIDFAVPDNLIWRLQFSPGDSSFGVYLHISAYTQESGQDERLYTHNPGGPTKLASSCVKRIHSSLQPFLDALVGRYPKIETRFEYLLAAAE
jgi:hypothetical protein